MQARRRQSPAGRTQRQWGALPGQFGAYIVMGAAALGALITMLAGSEPGPVLGVFLVAGTVAAALAVRPRAVFLLIPMPALAYVVAGPAAGLIHDQATDTSRTALAVSAAQWIASGFIAMIIATVVAIAITIARWPWKRRGLRGPGSPPPARGGGTDRPRRPPAARSPSARHGTERDADYLAATAWRPAGPRRPRD
jgi:hypothetical protein